MKDNYNFFLPGTFILLTKPISPSLLLHPPCGYIVNGVLQLRDSKQEERKKNDKFTIRKFFVNSPPNYLIHQYIVNQKLLIG